ncbi:alpha/beta fold hydrolase [Pendulispora albinea]|uniref:Alpha/beta hydrolase n=1 Tax=Pendulispora albinea TaxID=2741071 RepID=A0ABZ2LRQ7_9BACT
MNRNDGHRGIELGLWTRIAALASAALLSALGLTSCAHGASAPPSLPGTADRYAQIEATQLHYVESGEGTPVLLIPGWMQTSYVWRDVIPSLTKSGFRVIAVDPRGMGASSRPADGYDTGRVAGELHNLMTKLGHSRYMVVGHDIGVWIGYALASDHPEAVERLVVVEGSIPGLLAPADVFMPQDKSLFFWHFMFNQQRDLPEALIQGRERAFLGWLFDHWGYKPNTIALDVYANTYSAPGALSAQLAYYRAFPETMAQNKRRAERKLPMPVLALGGDHSKRDLQLAIMQPLAADVRGAILRDCGHFAPEECPGDVATHVTPFLKGER